MRGGKEMRNLKKEKPKGNVVKINEVETAIIYPYSVQNSVAFAGGGGCKCHCNCNCKCEKGM